LVKPAQNSLEGSRLCVFAPNAAVIVEISPVFTAALFRFTLRSYPRNHFLQEGPGEPFVKHLPRPLMPSSNRAAVNKLDNLRPTALTKKQKAVTR
jgi:hypothetical protein